MANHSRIKESARIRTAELHRALEMEIAARRRQEAPSAELEQMLSCLLALQDKDLPRFRISERAVTALVNPIAKPTPRFDPVAPAACVSEPTSYGLGYSVALYGTIGPVTRHGGVDAEALATAILQDWHRGKRICILSDGTDLLAAQTLDRMAAGEPTILESAVEIRAQSNYGVSLLPGRDSEELAAAARQQQANDRKMLETERLALSQSSDDILSILTARSALAQEVGDLNTVHQQCAVVLSVHTSLKTHLRELEASMVSAMTTPAKPPSAWTGLRRLLFGEDNLETRPAMEELIETKARIKRCEMEADQLALEMISRQAFITETTQHLLRRLTQYAPTFSELATTREKQKARIAEIDRQLKEWPQPVSASDIVASSRCVLARYEDVLGELFRQRQFDAVFMLNAERLPFATLYLAGSLTRDKFVLCNRSGNADQLACFSKDEICHFWFGKSWAEMLSGARACGMPVDWRPARVQ